MIFELIVGFATFVVCIHQTELYYKLLDKFKINFKPFNCVLCSTFWFTLVTTVFTFGIESIFLSSSAAVLAELLDKQLHKI